MHRTAIFCICALALLMTAEAGSKWPSIGTFALPDGGKATILVDTRSLTRRQGNVWTVKQKTLFTSVQNTTAGGAFRSEANEYAYDCEGKRAALVSDTKYEGEDVTGAVVETTTHPSPSEYPWVNPAAGSVLERAMKIVCGLAHMN